METTRRDPSLLTFFGLTWLVSWAFWLAASLAGGASGGSARPGLPMVLFLLGTFAPGFVAIGLTARREGSEGIPALLGRLFRWEVGPRWYLFALTWFAAIKLAVAVIIRVATGEWPRFGDEAWYLMVAATLGSTLMLGQAGEEVGWRGYALPRLAERVGLARASILLGVIWAAWHLPLFVIPGTNTAGQSFPLYLLQVTAISVAIAWLYARTDGSLFLTMLLHAAVNNTKDIVPSAVESAANPWTLSASLVGWLTVGLLWISAAYFLATMPRDLSHLSRPDTGKR